MVPIRAQVKAILGAVIAGLGALSTALADGSMTQLEWTTVALAAVVAYGSVYGVRQPPSLPKLPSRELFELAERAAAREQQR